jgi:hypothetical protein
VSNLATHAGLALADLATVHGLVRADLASLLGMTPLPLGGLPPGGGLPDPEGGAAAYTIAGAGTAAANGTVTYAGYLDIFDGRLHYWLSADSSICLYRTHFISTHIVLGWYICLDTDADGTFEFFAYSNPAASWTAPVNSWIDENANVPPPTVTAVP